MYIQRALKKVAVPALSKLGYTMEKLGGSSYAFMKADQTRGIIIDTESYPPKKLRFCFYVYGERPFFLELSNFKPQFCPVSALTYQTQEELEVYLSQVVQAAETTILPFLDAMADNVVTETTEMSRKLSENTAQRARRFAAAWNLKMESTKENLIRLDDIMKSMKTVPEKRKEDFIRQEEEIIDLAAYFGELIAINRGMPGRWMWRGIDEGDPQFVIEYHSYDPLERVIHAWNFGEEAITYALKSHPLLRRRTADLVVAEADSEAEEEQNDALSELHKELDAIDPRLKQFPIDTHEDVEYYLDVLAKMDDEK
jgi:hypothetical protein